MARETLVQGDVHGAACGYLRASEYFRAAASVYWPAHGDAAIADAMRLHSECFRASLDLDGPVYRQISLACTRFAVTAYLARPRRIAGQASLLICCGPSDATPEEQYLLAGRDALDHGWGVALVDPAACAGRGFSPEDTTCLVDRLTAAYTDFAGLEPTHKALFGIAESAGAANYLVPQAEAPEISWMTPVEPEFEHLQRRIRAPGGSTCEARQ
jgi:hypothetical protein